MWWDVMWVYVFFQDVLFHVTERFLLYILLYSILIKPDIRFPILWNHDRLGASSISVTRSSK